MLVLLQRYTIAISAICHIPPAQVELLPWWQFEDACDYVEQTREVNRRV